MAIIAGPTTANVAVTPAGGGWWLHDPLDAARDRRVYVGSESLELQTDEPQTVTRPLGRTDAVVVSGGVIESPAFSIEFSCPTPADVQGLAALRAGRRTLLLTSPYGHLLYVRLGQQQHTARLMGQRRTVDAVVLDAVVVAVP